MLLFLKIKKITLFIVVVGLILGCNPKPALPILDNLENALNEYGEYSDYVAKLNSAYSGDSTALISFIKIDNLYDGAAYDHGEVLISLLQHLGDNKFYEGLKNCSNAEQDNVRGYIFAGLDGVVNSRELIEKFPKTNSFLKVK
jgi:hypothetical protein